MSVYINIESTPYGVNIWDSNEPDSENFVSFSDDLHRLKSINSALWQLSGKVKKPGVFEPGCERAVRFTLISWANNHAPK